jgi:transcriptional regulator with XRE-family HTH domain
MADFKNGGTLASGNSFARIITMLRREKGISQKSAAEDLGISQALLSHYEKGIRECGLTFVVKMSEYYGVSCDYLLGRSPETSGRTLSFDDIPDIDPTKKEQIVPSEIVLQFNKKLIINALTILFTFISRTKSQTLLKNASLYFMNAIYTVFRIIHMSNSRNDKRFFEINEAVAFPMAAASGDVLIGGMLASAKGVHLPDADICSSSDSIAITSSSLTAEFPATASALLNVIKNAESQIQILSKAGK